MRSGRLYDLVDHVTAKVHGRKSLNHQYVGLEHIEPNGRTLIGTADSSVSESTNGVFESRDILFGKLRPSLRKAAQVDFSGFCSTDILVLRAKLGINARYAGHAAMSESIFRFAERHSIGTGMPRTSWQALSRAPVWIPPPQEQERIVEILDSIDAMIQTTTRIIEKRYRALRAIQSSLLRESDAGDRVVVGDLISRHWPGEWGEMHPSSNLDEVRVLRAVNLGTYAINYSSAVRRFVPNTKVAIKRLIEGDIVMETSGGGPGIPVGRVSRYREGADDIPHLTSNFVRALRPKVGVNSDYLFWLLDHEYRMPAIWCYQQQTTGIINLKIDDYLKKPVTYHRGTQDSIAQALDAALSVILAEERRLGKLRNLRSGLAEDLLSGRVRAALA